MKKFSIGFLLLITSIVLFIPLLIYGIIETIIALFYKKRFWKALGIFGDFILSIATVIDVMGNVICQIPFNRLLKKENGYDFGNRKDTISRVLGINQQDNTLTKLGNTLANFLDFLDKDHCKKSI